MFCRDVGLFEPLLKTSFIADAKAYFECPWLNRQPGRVSITFERTRQDWPLRWIDSRQYFESNKHAHESDVHLSIRQV